MAKAHRVPGVAADTPIGAFAARVIETRAAEVADLLEDPQGTTPDGIHDRRVALRRLRTALEVFDERLPKRARGVRRDLKQAFSALGPRRDADVALDLVKSFEPQLAAGDRQGFDGVVAALEARRAAAEGGLDIEAALQARADASALAARAEGRGGVVAAKALRKLATQRLASVRDGLVVLDAPDDAAALHRLRIAAKRLRYVLEAAEPALGTAAGHGASAARELQTVLGDVHDCDVLLPWLRDHRKALRAEDVAAVRAGRGAPNAPRYRGVQALDTLLRARRADLLERAAHERPRLAADLDRVAEALAS